MPNDEECRSRAWWRAPLVVILAALFAAIWWLVPPLLYRHTGAGADARLKAITDTRTALLAGLLGVGALLTFWLNSRIYRITARTFQVTEQGHITERYTKAIEQLGHEAVDVRLGGIYALERIAFDFERDHPTVVEVLGAYIREHTRPPTPTSHPARDDADLLPGKPFPAARPTTDVQAACTVLGRLPPRPGVSRGNLAGAYMQRVHLKRANLQGAELQGAHLERANLLRAHLEKADLSDAHLQGADLRGAYLQEAGLIANLEGADLTLAHLEGAQLMAVIPRGESQDSAKLDSALLTGAKLERARADRKTLWPVGFSWNAAGVVMLDTDRPDT